MSAPPTPVAAVVVDRGDGPHPRVRPVVLPWWQVILVRGARTYAQTVLGLVVVGLVVPAGVVAGDPGALGAGFWRVLAYAAVAGLAPLTISLLQNGVEVLSRLDQTNPELRG